MKKIALKERIVFLLISHRNFSFGINLTISVEGKQQQQKYKEKTISIKSF